MVRDVCDIPGLDARATWIAISRGSKQDRESPAATDECDMRIGLAYVELERERERERRLAAGDCGDFGGCIDGDAIMSMNALRVAAF